MGVISIKSGESDGYRTSGVCMYVYVYVISPFCWLNIVGYGSISIDRLHYKISIEQKTSSEGNKTDESYESRTFLDNQPAITVNEINPATFTMLPTVKVGII